jgi:hypothetical protein
VPEPGTRAASLRSLGFLLAGFLGFGGLMSLSLAIK